MRSVRLLSACVLAAICGVAVTGVGAQQRIPIDFYGQFDDEEDNGLFTLKGIDQRSAGKQTADALRAAVARGVLTLGPVTLPARSTGNGNQGAHGNGPNVQINDPSLDNIQSFPGTRPFEESTQSETSIVRIGQHVVVGYNTSAGQPIIEIDGQFFATQILFSGFSTSHDGGKTWKSGFVTPPPGSVATFGDPALATDRKGTIYYASLAGDADFNTVIGIGKSTDFGNTWSPMKIAFTDNGADKDWIAVGPDPTAPARDNVYVTWTRFGEETGSELMLSRSIDGGATFTTRSLFAPAGDAFFSNFIQASNPVVDASSGRLYIPFLHFSLFDADAVRTLVSDDGGVTFRFLAFNQAGAPDAFAYMNVTPGELIDCGRNNGGFRLVLHQGPDQGGGQFGLARYKNATRLLTQPAAAAVRGAFFIALNSSTSPFVGDPDGHSQIVALYSKDGGATWAAPLVVAAASTAEPQHVHPAVAVSQNGNRLNVAYYTQQADEKLRTDVATLHVDGNQLRLEGRGSLSAVSFDLTPSNIAFPIPGNAAFTTNYDRTVRACYNIGEYMSVTSGDDGKGVVAAWGDNRRSWTSPPDSPAAGTHAQADVFFSTIGN